MGLDEILISVFYLGPSRQTDAILTGQESVCRGSPRRHAEITRKINQTEAPTKRLVHLHFKLSL